MGLLRFFSLYLFTGLAQTVLLGFQLQKQALLGLLLFAQLVQQFGFVLRVVLNLGAGAGQHLVLALDLIARLLEQFVLCLDLVAGV